MHIDINILVGIVCILFAIYLFVKLGKVINTCPKCNSSKSVERILKLNEENFILPKKAGVKTILEKYKCHVCGNTWDIFIEEDNNA